MEYFDGKLRLLDQTRLPHQTLWLELDDYHQVISAVRELRVRGAPALGVVASYALAMAAIKITAGDRQQFMASLAAAAGEIVGARPTAVNMAWAMARMLKQAETCSDAAAIPACLLSEAQSIHREDLETNRALGRHGAPLMPDDGAVLTHCNTGALATAGFGTALGVIRAAWEDSKHLRVYATETRPVLQGARLTAWELVQLGIPFHLIADSAAGMLMRQGEIGCVIVGADRVAANGDTANKIGTYSLAVLARENNIPFYIAAPISTVDPALASGDQIPIEERSPEEVTTIGGVRTAPQGVRVRNPAFDVTPHRYISAIVTEQGVLRPPYTESLALARPSAVAGGGPSA